MLLRFSALQMCQRRPVAAGFRFGPGSDFAGEGRGEPFRAPAVSRFPNPSNRCFRSGHE